MNKHLKYSILILILFAALGVLIYFKTRPRVFVVKPMSQSQQKYSAAEIQHIVIIVEENKPESGIIGNLAAPYINSLAKQNSLAANYFAATNPSLPNYIALTSGTTAGITSDCNPPGGNCSANVKNIADSIEASGRTWKEYAESMPSPCYINNSGEYAVKHNPFLYYPDISNNSERCSSHDVPFSDFYKDLNSNLPNYSFITPNLCNDMHDCSVATGNAWLENVVPKILNSSAFKQRSLLILTWDEGNTTDNNVPAIFAGSAAKKGGLSGKTYSHYSMLKTIEYVWNLKPLTYNDQNSPAMTDMLN